MIADFLNFEDNVLWFSFYCLSAHLPFPSSWLFICHFMLREGLVQLRLPFSLLFAILRRRQRRNILKCRSSAETTTTADWSVAPSRKCAGDAIAYRLPSFTRLSLYDLANCGSAMKVHVDMPREYPSAFYIHDPRTHLRPSRHKCDDSGAFDSRINKVNSCEQFLLVKI